VTELLINPQLLAERRGAPETLFAVKTSGSGAEATMRYSGACLYLRRQL